MSKTAGIVIIGNEVLSGKTQDTNSYFFCTELRQLGVEVKKISTIQDEIELIGAVKSQTFPNALIMFLPAAVSGQPTTTSPSKALPMVLA